MGQRDLTAEFAGFDVIVNNTSIAMQVEELTLPPIERQTQTSRPGGSVGAIKSQHGLTDDFKATLKVKGYVKDLETLGAERGIAGVTIIARAGFADMNTGESFTNEITMRGRVLKWDRHGTYKQGDQIEGTFEFDLVDYEERREGQTIAKIDLRSSTFIVGNVDQAPALSALFG